MFCSPEKCTLENFRPNAAYNLSVCPAAKLKAFPRQQKRCPRELKAERFLVHPVPGDAVGSCDTLRMSLT